MFIALIFIVSTTVVYFLNEIIGLILSLLHFTTLYVVSLSDLLGLCTYFLNSVTTWAKPFSCANYHMHSILFMTRPAQGKNL